MHPTNGFQLSHSGINNGNASLAIFPSLQQRAIIISHPIYPIKLLLVILFRQHRKVIQQIVTKFSPPELEQIMIDPFSILTLDLLYFGPSQVRAHLTEVVVRA